MLPGERPENRALGMDLIRSLGMFIVLLAHGAGFLYANSTLVSPQDITVLFTIGYYAVEIFFALSGFLIGGILLRQVTKTDKSRVSGFWKYLARRWLRTLPVYLAVLVLLLLLQGWQTGTWEIRWNYVFFIQNWPDGAESFFPVSWSLAVEQWAYIFMPMVVLFFPFLLTRKGMSYHKALFLTSIGLIVLFMVLRTLMAVLVLDPATYDVGVRKQPHLRMDALLYGLLIAHCKIARPDWYRRLSSLPVFLTVLAAFLLLAVFQFNDNLLVRLPEGIPHFAFHAGLGLTLADLLSALFLPFMDINPLTGWLGRNNTVRKLVDAGSRYSYSVYLVHYAVMDLMYRVSVALRPANAHPLLDFFSSSLFLAAGVWISFVVAKFLYYHVEEPGMRLRRFIPK